jgi:hypothetical protein
MGVQLNTGQSRQWFCREDIDPGRNMCSLAQVELIDHIRLNPFAAVPVRQFDLGVEAAGAC